MAIPTERHSHEIFSPPDKNSRWMRDRRGTPYRISTRIADRQEPPSSKATGDRFSRSRNPTVAVGTSASLVVTSALLVVTKKLLVSYFNFTLTLIVTSSKALISNSLFVTTSKALVTTSVALVTRVRETQPSQSPHEAKGVPKRIPTCYTRCLLVCPLTYTDRPMDRNAKKRNQAMSIFGILPLI